MTFKLSPSRWNTDPRWSAHAEAKGHARSLKDTDKNDATSTDTASIGI